MAGLKKILILPYFGEFPEWFDKYQAPTGYTMLIDRDLEKFKERVRSKLGIEYPGVWGNPKVWDYRCALGLLYENEIKDYDFWGHADLDVVWGDLNKFVPDSLLENLDVYSSHSEYVCGCFSLYRNSPFVNDLFKTSLNWREYMVHPEPNGWVEGEYSRILERSGLRYKYDFPQGNPWDRDPKLRKADGVLEQVIHDKWVEIGLFHFRHTKRWPL